MGSRTRLYSMPMSFHSLARFDPSVRLALRALCSAHAGPVDLDLGRGECIAIVGESGSGKSVLLRMIADLIPNEGTVLLDGAQRASWTAPAWRSMVVYQAAEPAWWDATARAHLPASEQKRAQALADALKLRAAALDTDLELLSTGERQRLALIRSLACRPRVLLLDEPASALDAASTAALEALLRSELERGTSVLVVTHSEEQAERLGQRCLRMASGRLEVA
ncbi:ABC transporter family protein [Pseudoduganella lurida]|jgi:ABC-type iron transport system FetAB ATPase subunit|uniref:ABC transporter family protein n=3 Tax=Burkholderiales TaxID=80840 RepID=A0A562RKZ5_9BURK|nr:ABC transporter family protein [Herbaspirillum sp. SJZ107]TWI69106.1 ABC transporter family protein [Pseudoduganella lurida]